MQRTSFYQLAFVLPFGRRAFWGSRHEGISAVDAIANAYSWGIGYSCGATRKILISCRSDALQATREKALLGLV
jgi:hypothetical protein